MCRVPQFLKAPLDAHLRLTAGLAGRRRIPQGPLRVAPLAGPNFCASAASAPLPSILRRGREPGPSATSAGLRRTRRSGVCIPREASGGRVRQRQPPSQKVEPAQTHPRTSGRAKRSPAERRALTARGTRPRRRPRPPRATRGAGPSPQREGRSPTLSSGLPSFLQPPSGTPLPCGPRGQGPLSRPRAPGGRRLPGLRASPPPAYLGRLLSELLLHQQGDTPAWRSGEQQEWGAAFAGFLLNSEFSDVPHTPRCPECPPKHPRLVPPRPLDVPSRDSPSSRASVLLRCGCPGLRRGGCSPPWLPRGLQLSPPPPEAERREGEKEEGGTAVTVTPLQAKDSEQIVSPTDWTPARASGSPPKDTEVTGEPGAGRGTLGRGASLHPRRPPRALWGRRGKGLSAPASRRSGSPGGLDSPRSAGRPGQRVRSGGLEPLETLEEARPNNIPRNRRNNRKQQHLSPVLCPRGSSYGGEAENHVRLPSGGHGRHCSRVAIFFIFFFQRGNFVTCRSWDIKLRGAISVFLKTCFIT